MDRFHPDVVAVERVFAQNNAPTVVGTAQAGGWPAAQPARVSPAIAVAAIAATAIQAPARNFETMTTMSTPAAMTPSGAAPMPR